MKIKKEKMNDELEKKLEVFSENIESMLEGCREYEESQINDGEYNYLVSEGDYNSRQDIELEDELQDALDKSSLSTSQLVDYVVENNLFECSYESLSSPFAYGGAAENEFHSMQWGGDKEHSFENTTFSSAKPSFVPKDHYSREEFLEAVKYVNSGGYEDVYVKLFYDNEKNVSICDNTDYDMVRVLIDCEHYDQIYEHLKENPKPKEVFKSKKLHITEKEYRELCRDNYGFCEYCGETSDSYHEPDAREYTCDHCEKPHSFGIEEALVHGLVIIKEDDREIA